MSIAQPNHRLSDNGGRLSNVLLGGFMSQGKSQRGMRLVLRKTHREENMRRVRASGRARAAIGTLNAFQIERHEHGGIVGVVETEIGGVANASFAISIHGNMG